MKDKYRVIDWQTLRNKVPELTPYSHASYKISVVDFCDIINIVDKYHFLKGYKLHSVLSLNAGTQSTVHPNVVLSHGGSCWFLFKRKFLGLI